MKHFDFRSTAIASMLFAAAAFTACTNPETETRQNPATDIAAKTDDGKRSVEQALDNLHQLLEIIDGKGTRARSRSIRSVEALSFEEFSPTTRASDGNTGDLVYIVNFENDEGYAILGADNRIAPVVAVTSKGSIGKQDLKWVLDTTLINDAKPYDPNDYHDSEFYDKTDDDFYLNDSDSTLVSNLIHEYIYRIIAPTEPEYIDEGKPNPGDDFQLKTEKKAPLVKTKWDQTQPFNNNTPKNKNKENWPIGCTVTATAQILTNTKTANIKSFGLTDTTTVWDSLEIRKHWKDFQSTYETDIAILFKKIADEIKIKYNFYKSGSSYASPSNVCRYMKKIGYNDAKLHRSYSKNNIIDMLKDNKPVFIGAFDLENWEIGHAWVIDGYITIYGEIYKNNRLVESFERYSWLHCNWGWGGNCDGYYESEVFRTGSSTLRKGIDEVDEYWAKDPTTGEYITIPSPNDKTIVSFGDSSKARYHYRYITY